MKYKRLSMLLIGLGVLVLVACGNQSGNRDDLAPTSSEPVATSQSPSYKELYQASVFLGDSITEGLAYHDVLDEGNVLAGAGKTAEFTLMEDDVDRLVERKPERVFIQLGSDDILWPTDDPMEYSLSHYAKLIDNIKARLPKAKITLLSVTPVNADAEKKEPRYGNIQEYNAGLETLADQKQVEYVDLTSLVTEHADLYDTDGIHFQAAFYPILLDYLATVRNDR
ncbi:MULTISPECIES: GDSL-type esterase/lipase family protein [Paenibacillus]|uniref:GDSL-type esterase/lipase family protein n=1 Tax=Paenibacillus TaxID=44249 RepID=UPI0003609971|nr:GDSL-type esterase/lipase family protein [Paenibacillus massiliensis]